MAPGPTSIIILGSVPTKPKEPIGESIQQGHATRVRVGIVRICVLVPGSSDPDRGADPDASAHSYAHSNATHAHG